MGQVVLTELNVYPIKSAGGITVQSAVVERRGLEGDRRWMVVNEQGKFLTQRSFPQMALIEVSMQDEALVLNAPGLETLTVPQPSAGNLGLEVEVWGDFCQAIFAGEAAKDWMSRAIGIPCQLVYMPEESLRLVDRDYAKNDEIVGFADAFPFLLISEASLQDLNRRLESPIPMNRFRPNLVVSGCDPFAEDSWKQIRIGSIVFQVAKPCSRCAVTTVDQATGTPGKEPLITLAKYRNQPGGIMFGQNLLHTGSGSIAIGDTVEILE